MNVFVLFENKYTWKPTICLSITCPFNRADTTASIANVNTQGLTNWRTCLACDLATWYIWRVDTWVLESLSNAMQITDSLLAQVRKSGSLVVMCWSPKTLMITAFSCCLNVSFGNGAALGPVLLLLFFLDGVRLLVRVVAPLLANNRGDLRSWARSRRGCWFFFGVRGVRAAAAAVCGTAGWRLRVDSW